MRAVVLTGHGDLDKLEYRTSQPIPRLASGDVLVEVGACGVNNTDINTRVGWYSGGSWGGSLEFPRIQGADPVGRIIDVGPAVQRDRIATRVLIDPWLRDDRLVGPRYLGSEVDGGFADYVAVPSANAAAIESDLTDVELATFACSYSTAENMLEKAGVSADEWVLVTGASGGVGSALVQLAKRRQARVLALTTHRKMGALRSLGADEVLDRTEPGLASRIKSLTDGVDVLADVVGGDGFASLFDTIRPGGRYVVSGAVAGPIVDLDLRTLYLRDISMHGTTVVPEEVFSNLVGYIERGDVTPLVDRTFALDELVAAQEYFLKREHIGAVVIDIRNRG